ncbi:MgtC/SapB family protein [uncultured Alistipes sp.]|uniref:MgtC/SapB family protein n=1 Tax=uncultured Alistipes sp. TaxID=538949 RepID=UPI0026262D6E|nr:MgtC/SapB family protein [uncultured Alistipes sp.]
MFDHEDEMMEWNFILRLCVAGLCGTVIGLDREYRVKDAGFRTHFLVALGSALMMIVSQYGFEGFLADHDGTRFDPGRIAAQVVSGIGFIGAGTIIIHRQLVRGLTTAASLWATAGIGLAAGGEMYVVAGAATLLTLFGLEVLTLFFGELGHRRTMIVFSAADRAAIDEMFNRLQCRDYSVVSYEVEASRTPEGVVHRATLVIRSKGTVSEEGYIDLLRGNPDITVERIV